MKKNILGFEDYMITNDGMVYSKRRGVAMKQDCSSGYARVLLQQNGIKQRFLVHRLVAQHFLDIVDNKDFINHIDGNKLNNKVENLEWCTHSENMRHALETGLRKMQKYDKRPNSKKIQQLDKNTLEILGEWNSVAEAADVTDSNCHHIANVALGKRKTHNGFKWRYV